MTTSSPSPPEGRPAGPGGPVPAVPVAGSPGEGPTGGSGAVEANGPQPQSDVEVEGAGSNLAGGGGSPAGSDVEPNSGPAGPAPRTTAGVADAEPVPEPAGTPPAARVADAESDPGPAGPPPPAGVPDAEPVPGPAGRPPAGRASDAEPDSGPGPAGTLPAAEAAVVDAEPGGGPTATQPRAEASDQEPEDGPTRSRTDPAPAVEGFEGDPTAWPPDEAFEAVELDDEGWTRRDLEAILVVADEPVPASALAEIVGARLSEVEELLVDLAGEYARDGRGFVLRAIAGGWRLYTNPGAKAAVEAYLRAGQQSRLTRAALETLAVIAYRQPVTRFQVAAVRGVNVDGVFRTLASRGLIHEVGTDPGPGQAALYGTTPAFLEQLGLNSLDQLPPIKDYLPEGVDLLDLQEQP
jgi:segregation and condensation protein B